MYQDFANYYISLYDNIANNTEDELSDIDIKIDVSGYDNGKFMLELPHLIKKMNVVYYDFAPSTLLILKDMI